MNRMLGAGVAIALAAAGSMAAGQGRDVDQILAGARTALGGEKLAAVKTLTALGRTVRALPNGTSAENEFEIALELPDKYLMRSVIAAMGNMSVYRNTGFNGGQVIEEIDRPPSLSGGGFVHLRIAGPGGVTNPEQLTAEQKVEFDQKRLVANKREFAKLALGMFAMSPAAYPVELSDGGQAESPDGKADVIEVKGEGGFAAKLFIDAGTHLPLMLSWMDREPITMVMGPGGTASAGGGGMTVTRGGAPGGSMSPEEREKLMKDLDARRKEAEAKARTVEYRVYYGDYKSVGGVQLPHRIQRSIDGKPTEEMIFDTVKVNPKIDARKFQTSK
ncbi:MAG: hypothetical protein R6V57_01795 [Vicinamibacterales bacterium]